MAVDWRDAIADAGRIELGHEVGGVIVQLPSSAVGGPVCVSRIYRLDDYADSRKLHDVVAAQATRHLNADHTVCNYYAAHRYADGSLCVYTGRHSILKSYDAAES